MKIGEIYVNGAAGKRNPHRVGVYIGQRGKLAEFLHTDGQRTRYDRNTVLVLAGSVFHARELQEKFERAEEEHGQEADDLAAETWHGEFPQESAARKAAMVSRFWKMYAARLGGNVEVFISAERVKLDGLLDVRGRPVHMYSEILPPTGHFFFVDLAPETNWEHECAFVFVTRDELLVWHDARWPPSETWGLEPLLAETTGGER